MYLKLIDGNPVNYSLDELRLDNPQVSFPVGPPEYILSEYSVYPYTIAAVPNYNPLLEVLIQGKFEIDPNGSWILPYKVQDLSLLDASNNMRTHRNNLLSETDWMALSDMTLTEPWAAYRQSLRDITSQAGFPYDIEWPIKPE